MSLNYKNFSLKKPTILQVLQTSYGQKDLRTEILHRKKCINQIML